MTEAQIAGTLHALFNITKAVGLMSFCTLNAESEIPSPMKHDDMMTQIHHDEKFSVERSPSFSFWFQLRNMKIGSESKLL